MDSTVNNTVIETRATMIVYCKYLRTTNVANIQNSCTYRGVLALAQKLEYSAQSQYMNCLTLLSFSFTASSLAL